MFEEEGSIFFFYKKMFFSKCCPGLIKCTFSNSAEVFYAKVRKGFVNVRYWTKTFAKFPKSVFRQKKKILWTLGKHFWQTPKIFDQNTSKIQKQKRPEKFLWTPNMPLKNAAKSFCPCPYVFRSKSEKQKRVFLKTLFSSKNSSGRIEGKFGHTANFFQSNFQNV